MEIIGVNLTKGQARGIEQVLIQLNNNGTTEEVEESVLLDNKQNSTNPNRTKDYYTRFLQGFLWLARNRPNWQKDYHRPPGHPKLKD